MAVDQPGIARPTEAEVVLTFPSGPHAAAFAEWWAGPGAKAFARVLKPRPKPPAKRIAAPPAARPRNPLFDAVAEVATADPALNGGVIGKVAASLAAAGYTADDVRAFGRAFPAVCPWGAGRPPTVGEIEKYISRAGAEQAGKAGRSLLDAVGG